MDAINLMYGPQSRHGEYLASSAASHFFSHDDASGAELTQDIVEAFKPSQKQGLEQFHLLVFAGLAKQGFTYNTEFNGNGAPLLIGPDVESVISRHPRDVFLEIIEMGCEVFNSDQAESAFYEWLRPVKKALKETR